MFFVFALFHGFVSGNRAPDGPPIIIKCNVFKRLTGTWVVRETLRYVSWFSPIFTNFHEISWNFKNVKVLSQKMKLHKHRWASARGQKKATSFVRKVANGRKNSKSFIVWARCGGMSIHAKCGSQKKDGQHRSGRVRTAVPQYRNFTAFCGKLYCVRGIQKSTIFAFNPKYYLQFCGALVCSTYLF